MWELLKEYLENNELYNYKNVEIIEFIEDGSKCNVRFKSESSAHEIETTLKLWWVLAYVNSKN